MKKPITPARIPDAEYSDYRYDVIFKAYKWDPQVQDHNTISRYAALIDRDTADQLARWAEQLARETVLMEESLLRNLALARELGLPKTIYKSLSRAANYERDRNVRLMRFDFHPTTTGWAVSEVNSDVPGGLAEASVLPAIAARFFDGYAPVGNVADSLLNAFKATASGTNPVALVHCTSYSDDRQVMQFLGDYFNAHGVDTLFAAPDHIKWVNRRAVSVAEGRERALGGIARFFPAEWLANLPRKSDWRGFFDSETPSCNHPVAVLAQSKRLPVVWDRLGVDITAWRELLPETTAPRRTETRGDDWLYKPALGRVGEGISIKEAVSEKELRRIEKTAQRYPKLWVAQRRFRSAPIRTAENEEYHLCVGVFTVNGRCAGFYGRTADYPRIDANAVDIPILVEKGTAK
ncbi:MAG: glutathionylspermidine synthase family protein [Oscillospiraceae bacterium]|nr:glutathionylspermidine synthase family protein [Oscillospiraceae bacterium]